MGHPDDNARCVGHTYPARDCPNPDVHKQLFTNIITSPQRHSTDNGKTWHTVLQGRRDGCKVCTELMEELDGG